jgi:dihydrofolate synthase/folylpolyglutamate synthase
MFTYKDALSYIYSFTDYEKKSAYRYAPENFDLRRVERLLALLDNPHDRFRVIHVAGTKGKGSTSAMIASILRAAGYRTGLYTSPHLHTFRERIQVDGNLIAKEMVAALTAQLQPLVSQVEGLTTFEIITALGFVHFARQGVALAVLEVGLGGRLDATNVVSPLVAVITSLSYDHTHVLGHTLPQIAREKAGIVKAGIPVVSAPQQPEALAVVQEVCREKGAPLIVVGQDWRWARNEANLDGQAFQVGRRLTGTLSYNHLWIPLLGEHQVVNAVTAIAAIDELRRYEVEVDPVAIVQGLRQVRWPGRLEILARQPIVVADSAHNADSADKLAAALEDHFSYKRLILIFGASRDKDIDGMLETLLPHTWRVIVTRSDHPRAADPPWLREKVVAHGREAIVTNSVVEALEQALALAHEDDLICAAGSVFIAAAAREAAVTLQGHDRPEGDP